VREGTSVGRAEHGSEDDGRGGDATGGRVPRDGADGGDESPVGRRMTRRAALEAVHPRLEGCAVVTIMGAVAAELQSLGHRENFFYLQHAMGLASSVGLGIALARPGLRVVVFDGDGSVLMNLGGLTTLGRYRPPNLTHVVFDNESLLSVGGFPTATAAGTDLAGVAEAAGVPRSATVRELGSFARAFGEALESDRTTTLVAKVAESGPSGYVTDLSLLENRFAFRRWLDGRPEAAAGEGSESGDGGRGAGSDAGPGRGPGDGPGVQSEGGP